MPKRNDTAHRHACFRNLKRSVIKHLAFSLPSYGLKEETPQTLALLTEEEELKQPMRQASKSNECLDYVEAISPAFDPKSVLLRRIFFLNEDKSKYVSIGYYPARNYERMVEFGCLRNSPIILTETQVRYLAEVIPHMCHSLCINESKTFKYGDLKLTKTGSIKVARLYFGTRYISLKLEELGYLQDMFYIIHNQQLLYMCALRDVLTYVISAQSSTTYIEPHPNASMHVLYPQLFEEIKTMLIC
jgi:hypothetical protein